MIRVSVMADDSLLVDAIALILAEVIAPDVLQLTYRQPRHIYEAIRDHRSILINVDDAEPEDESTTVTDQIRYDSPLLVIKISLKTMNIHIHESYQLINPGVEQVTKLVRDFSGTHLKKNEEALTWAI